MTGGKVAKNLTHSPAVLIVDDDRLHREAIGRDFSRRGFRVLLAAGGDEAWSMVLREAVHLVVTDIRMAGGSGVELLGRIKGRIPAQPPVILMTGYTELNLADAKDWGAEAVFCKPLDRGAFLAASIAIVAAQGFSVAAP